jgi:hypothetical protein
MAACGAPEITIEQPMKIQRRKFLYLAAAGAVPSWLCRPASAQTYYESNPPRKNPSNLAEFQRR